MSFNQHVKHNSNAFCHLKLSNFNILEKLSGRESCSKCGASRKFFCYTCCLPVNRLKGKIPSIKLPVRVDIIKHRGEKNSKSTAAHAAVLAPSQVTIFHFPDIPDYSEALEEVLILFPSSESISLQQALGYGAFLQTDINEPLVKRRRGEKEENGLRVVFVDCTWAQTHSIFKDARLSGIPKVEIKEHKTYFWRPQSKKPDTYLATIEAIYYFLVEYHKLAINEAYAGEYDDMMYLFAFMQGKISELSSCGKYVKGYSKECGKSDRVNNNLK